MARLARILSGSIAPLTNSRVLKSADYARLEEGGSLLEDLAREQRMAKQEAARSFEEHKQRGYEEGLAKSEEARAAQAFETVARAIDYFEGMEEDMISLLESALDKIADEIDKDKLVRQVIVRALRDYRSLPQITIHISRSQERALHKDIERLAQEARLAGLVKVSVNSRLEEGSCLLESPLGTVELGINSQIASLKSALGALRSTPRRERALSKTNSGKTNSIEPSQRVENLEFTSNKVASAKVANDKGAEAKTSEADAKTSEVRD